MMLSLRNALVCSLLLAVSAFGVACTSSNDGSSSCATDNTISCLYGAVGFSCSDNVPPDVQEPGYRCSDFVTNGSEWDYCCIESNASWGSCVQDETIQGGCSATNGTSYVYGFICSGRDAPGDIPSMSVTGDDPSLTCSEPGGSPGAQTYCCQ